jgi:P-type E1-E2 ATPase
VEVHLLTGDRARTAQAVARALGIDARHVHAEVLPERKAAEVAERKAKGQVVAMVGDGVNDAPRWRRRTWASPWAGAPTWPWRPRRWR